MALLCSQGQLSITGLLAAPAQASGTNSSGWSGQGARVSWRALGSSAMSCSLLAPQKGLVRTSGHLPEVVSLEQWGCSQDPKRKEVVQEWDPTGSPAQPSNQTLQGVRTESPLPSGVRILDLPRDDPGPVCWLLPRFPALGTL